MFVLDFECFLFGSFSIFVEDNYLGYQVTGLFFEHKKMEETSSKPPSFVSRHGKKLVVLSVWVAIVIYVIIDQVTKPCVNFETNSTRVQRLLKAGAPLVSNGTTNCDASPGIPGPTSTYVLSNVDGRCHFPDACISTALNLFVQWVAINPASGAIVLALVYIIAVVMFVPASILTLGAGASFSAALGFSTGVIVASVSVFVGASIGAILAFLLGRYVLHDFVQKTFIKKFALMQAIDDAITEVPMTVMILLRLSPLVPFNALNYIMSGTNIPTKSYVVGLLGMIPATVAFVILGASIHGAADAGVQGQSVNTVLFVVGGACAFLAVIVVSYFAKKKLNEKIGLVSSKRSGSVEDDEGEVVVLGEDRPADTLLK